MFITVEGPEGGGKSTLIRALATEIAERSKRVTVTREPGGGPLGFELRQMLLHSGKPTPETELMLFLADRADHVANVINPALERGDWVICDRYTDSTVVYQGHARGLDIPQLRALNDFVTKGLKPSKTLLLDIDPEIGLARQQTKDRLDSEGLEFHRKVRNGFLEESWLEPERWIVLDAARPPDVVLQLAIQALDLKH